uniref:Uncharacterized protein n=1 Tax=Magallana gigas TaxID=29159 RepID=K1QCN2_MAGGI
MARRQNYMILEPAYRRLHKLKEMATEENVSPKIRAEIDAIIDLLKVRADYCEDQSTKPSEDLLRLMEATLHHQWKDAFEQGKLSYVPTTLMMSGNLEAPKGMILVDNALFFGDPYTKEGYMGKAGEGITSFNDIVREDGNVHKMRLF